MAPHTSNRKKDRLESGSRNTRRPSTGGHKHTQLAAKRAKQGRHSKLTGSEKRKLTRLYMYTELSTEDICEVLRRLTGKSISVRCAQNNIKGVLHTTRLVSARPRNRTECRLRMTHTRRYRELSVAGKRRDEERRSKARTDQLSPSPQPISGGLQGEPENETPPLFSSIKTLWYSSVLENETEFNIRGNLDSIAPPEELASMPWNHETEPSALAGVQDKYLGFSDIEFLTEPLEHVPASFEPVSGYETLISSPAASPQRPEPGSFSEGLFADELIWDQYVNYPLEPSNALAGHSPWAELTDHHFAPQVQEALEPDSFEADVDVTSIGVALSFGSPHSQRTSIPTQISTDLHRDVVQQTFGPEFTLESNTENFGSKRQKSWSPSLRSFTKRLSYSSSQISEIMTAFDHFSLSSKGTKRSSAAVSSPSPLNEIPWTLPQVLALDTIYVTEYPVDLPGGFLEYGADGCTLSSWCSECLDLLDSSFRTTSSQYAPLKFSIEDYGGFSCLDILRLDRFDNTTLHVAAAIGLDYKSIIGLMKRGGNPNSVNTAGQTFLHVLDPRNLSKREDHLPALLSYVSRLGFDFGKVDHQGVNVLQVLLQYDLHHTTVIKLFATLTDHLVRGTTLGDVQRDNLGRTWLSRLRYLAQEAELSDPERSEALDALFWSFAGNRPVQSCGAPAFDEGPSARVDVDSNQLEDIVAKACSQFFAEDYYGRNGLHCLARVRFEDASNDEQPTSTRKQSMSLRRQFRQSQCTSLLGAGVNPNAYDKVGNTPLLAFLQSSYTRAEGNDDDGEIEFYMKTLVKAGACVNGRNRKGESPLHVAIKLGIISATRVLLELGANVHARQKDGKGVVKLGLDAAQKITEEMEIHKTLHIRIMACLHIARARGAIDEPTFLDEWQASRSCDERFQQTSNGLSVRLPEHGLKLPAHVYDKHPISIESGRWLVSTLLTAIMQVEDHTTN